jgi:hypothetical protein
MFFSGQETAVRGIHPRQEADMWIKILILLTAIALNGCAALDKFLGPDEFENPPKGPAREDKRVPLPPTIQDLGRADFDDISDD